MRNDVVRVGVSLILLAFLAAWGLPFWLFLSLPVVAYGGLRLLLVAPPEIEAPRGQPARATGERAAYDNCIALRTRIDALSGQVQDEGVIRQLHAVTACVEKSLDAIAEDAKYAAAMPLSDLLGFTDQLLSAYVKVVRRGFAEPDLHPQIVGRLCTIERACGRFWDRLNRDAVVDLRALNETIEVLLEVAGRSPEEPGAVRSQPGVASGDRAEIGRQPESVAAMPLAPEASGTTRASVVIPKLTPREREILCLLPTGKTDQEIASEQFISPRTVSKHIETVYHKLGVRNRAEAVAFTVRHGLCDEADEMSRDQIAEA